MFSAADVPPLKGQVFVITGGNSGIGFETVAAKLWEVSETLTQVRYRFDVAASR